MPKSPIPFYYKITNLYWMLGRKKSRKCAKSITWRQEQFQIFATFIALFNTRFGNCNFRYIIHYDHVNDGWISHNVFKKFQFCYCITPKVGSTTWIHRLKVRMIHYLQNKVRVVDFAKNPRTCKLYQSRGFCEIYFSWPTLFWK